MNALTIVARKVGEVHACTLYDACTVALILKPGGATASGRVWPSPQYAKAHFQWIAEELDNTGFVIDGPVMERELPDPARRNIRRIAESGRSIRVQNPTRRMLLGYED